MAIIRIKNSVKKRTPLFFFDTIRPMKTILHLYWRDGVVNVRRLAGIHRFAMEHGMRSKALGLFYPGLGIRQALKLVPVDMIVLEEYVATRLRTKPEEFGNIPVVVADITPELEALGFTGIRASEAATHKAIDALLALNFEHYAFVGKDKQEKWTIEREALARGRFTAAGKTYHEMDRYPTANTIPKMLREIKVWLSALPRPCGILAANDVLGEWVLEAAYQLDIPIPGAMAVIGIDNDPSICEYTYPTLASVSPDFETSGMMAAAMALEMLKRPGWRPAPVGYGANEIVRRRSIREFKPFDAKVQEALDFIRREVGKGIGPSDVIRHIGLGPRAAQQRFLRATGRTIKNEISAVRIATACELLRNPDLTMAEIVSACGYRNEHAFRLMFKRINGLSPAAWRKNKIH